jgi:hypothetical protein
MKFDSDFENDDNFYLRLLSDGDVVTKMTKGQNHYKVKWGVNFI